jgi:hypothetical protein
MAEVLLPSPSPTSRVTRLRWTTINYKSSINGGASRKLRSRNGKATQRAGQLSSWGLNITGSKSDIKGTSLSNVNSHANNLLALLAAGGFRHSQHLALGGKHDSPLPNAFVMIPQQLGVEPDHFAPCTGTMRVFEMG